MNPEEEKDWMLFLLLEGELEGEELQKVEQLIQENAEWKKAWDLMKLSVLPEDSSIALSSAEKSILKKRGATILPPPFEASWMSYVAAASVLLLAFWYWGFYQTGQTPPQLVQSEANPLLTPEKTAPAPNSGTIIDSSSTPILSDKSNLSESLAPPTQLTVSTKKKRAEENIAFAIEAEQINIRPLDPEIELTPSSPSYVMPGFIYTKTFGDAPTNEVGNKKIMALMGNATEWVNNTRRIWSAIQDPELSFRRVKTDQGPGLAIDFNSHAYGASAQLIVKNDFIKNLKMQK